jgi:hypothetical protein
MRVLETIVRVHGMSPFGKYMAYSHAEYALIPRDFVESAKSNQLRQIVDDFGWRVGSSLDPSGNIYWHDSPRTQDNARFIEHVFGQANTRQRKNSKRFFGPTRAEKMVQFSFELYL